MDMLADGGTAFKVEDDPSDFHELYIASHLVCYIFRPSWLPPSTGETARGLLPSEFVRVHDQLMSLIRKPGAC